MRTALAILSLALSLPYPLHAQAPDAWARVQQLAPGTSLKVTAERGSGACTAQSVSADSLICSHGSSTHAFPRAEIKSIKLMRRGHSAMIGLALGAGIGAGAGAGVGSAINSSNSNSFIHTSGAKSAGVGAAIGVVLGSATGAVVGYSTDLFAGSAIYRR